MYERLGQARDYEGLVCRMARSRCRLELQVATANIAEQGHVNIRHGRKARVCSHNRVNCSFESDVKSRIEICLHSERAKERVMCCPIISVRR